MFMCVCNHRDGLVEPAEIVDVALVSISAWKHRPHNGKLDSLIIATPSRPLQRPQL